MSDRIYICESCKKDKLLEKGKFQIGIHPCYIGDCDLCKSKPRELYSYLKFREE